MNHPAKDPIEEIRELASLGMQFIDLTLEPPCAASWEVNPTSIRKVLDELGLGVVGHTAWYLPLASAIPEVRHSAVEELQRCLQVFSAIGVKWMNIHPDRHAPWHSRDFW